MARKLLAAGCVSLASRDSFPTASDTVTAFGKEASNDRSTAQREVVIDV
jgi:hypothetical protein